MSYFRNDRKVVSPEERKAIQLEMLSSFDTFCRAYQIRYSLAYGTLLGAIRHKGFIPWDDDLDIMMPISDLWVVRDLLNSDIMEYRDVFTHDSYEYGFSRLIHKQSFSKVGLVARSYGVNIDVYPVYTVPDESELLNKYIQDVNKYLRIRMFLKKWRSRIIRVLPIKNIPFFSFYVKRFAEVCYQYATQPFHHYMCAGMPEDISCVYDRNLFDEVIDVEFEGKTFMAISDYDYFLTNRYGDYMTPPPKDEQTPRHSTTYYWC
jgi:lipopolysaccharide cholinephosphotransferase